MVREKRYEEVSLPTVGLRRPLLRRVRGPGGRLQTHLPGIGRGGRGRTAAQEATQKEYGRGGRHKDQGGLAGSVL